jgi:prefoldin alpha subunit
LEKRKLASKNEEELRKLSVEMRLLEQTAETIQARMNVVNSVLADATIANMTLEGIEKEKENAELLVPVGANSYIRAKLENPDKVVMGVGAGVSVEKTLPETKEIIQKRLTELENTRLSLQQQFTQVAEKMNQDREKFEHLIAEMRQGKAQKDV